MAGKKTGGRQAGTPNKRTIEIQEILAELNCNPIEGMARIAMDEKNSPELRGKMYSELAQYVAPKRKAIEVQEVWDGDLSKLTDEQLARMLEQFTQLHHELTAAEQQQQGAVQ